ncbi:MAG: hypothetical protein VCD31_06275 [Alphaproteobacteria bacterium]
MPLADIRSATTKPVAPRDDRCRLGLIGVVQILTVLPPDLDGVAKAFGRDKRRGGIIALDQRIGRGRGAVQQMRDLCEIQPRLLDRLNDAERAVGPGRQNLRRYRFIRLLMPAE